MKFDDSCGSVRKRCHPPRRFGSCDDLRRDAFRVQRLFGQPVEVGSQDDLDKPGLHELRDSGVRLARHLSIFGAISVRRFEELAQDALPRCGCRSQRLQQRGVAEFALAVVAPPPFRVRFGFGGNGGVFW